MTKFRRGGRKAGAVPVSDEELARVHKQQQLEEEQQKARAMWNVLLGQKLLQRLGHELEDVHAAIEEAKTGVIRNANGIRISANTLKSMAEEHYMSYRKLFYDQVAKERELRDAWKVTDDDLKKFFEEKVIGAPKE